MSLNEKAPLVSQTRGAFLGFNEVEGLALSRS